MEVILKEDVANLGHRGDVVKVADGYARNFLLPRKLAPVALSFTRKSGEAGHLFGSVTSADIAAGLEAKGFEIDRRKIQLDEPLKSVGDFTVAIKLYREVTAHIKVTVLAEASTEVSADAAAEAATGTSVSEPVAEAAAAE